MSAAPQAVRTGRTALESLLARMATMAFSVVAGILVAKALGPQGKGAYSAVQLAIGTIVAFSGGSGTAVTYLLTKARRSIDDVLPVLALALVAMTLGAWMVLAIWGVGRGIGSVVLIGAIVLPASIVLSWQQSYYTAGGNLRRFNLRQVVLGAASAGAIALALYGFHAAIGGVLLAWALCTYGAAAYFVLDLLRARTHERHASLRENLRTFARFGGQSGVNVFLGLLNYRIDSLIVVAAMGTAALGIYSVAVSVGELLFMISRSVTMAITRQVGTSSLEDAASLTARAIRISTAMTGVCALVCWFAGPPAIALVYGPAFEPGALVLHVLLPGIVAFSSSGTFVSFFLFQLGRPSIVTWWNAGMLAVQSIGCALLVPRLGLAGAAAASSASYLLGVAFNTWYFARVSGIGARRLWLISRADVYDVREAVARMLHRPAVTPAASARRKILVVTGAAGSVATLLRPLLRERYDLRLSDVRRVGDLAANETFHAARLDDLVSLRRILRGADAVLHLGGVSTEEPFERILQSNICGTRTMFEAARLEGVKRVVFASSGHVTGFYPKRRCVGADDRVRPDTLYAASKAWGEALGSLYADKYAMQVLSIRIGWVTEKPVTPLALSIWLSPRDLAQLVRIGVEHPRVRNDVVFGVSENAARWWHDPAAEALGYRPQDRAEASCVAPAPAAQAMESPVAAIFQGADFAARGFAGDTART